MARAAGGAQSTYPLELGLLKDDLGLDLGHAAQEERGGRHGGQEAGRGGCFCE
jgi:hypothetical protein